MSYLDQQRSGSRNDTGRRNNEYKYNKSSTWERDLNNDGSFMEDGSQGYMKKRHREDDDRYSGLNKPKLMSAIAAVSSSVVDSDVSILYLNDSSRNLVNYNYADKPPTNEAYTKPDTVKRNKRMFGALMGHLDLARKKLEIDSTLIDRQKRLKELVTEKNQSESKKVAQMQRLNARIEKDKVSYKHTLSSQ